MLMSLSCAGPGHEWETNSPAADSLALSWPTGSFKLYEEEATYTEVWTQQNANTYVGYGYHLSNTDCDTLFSMSMRLYRMKDKLLMAYLVKGQNDNKETEFTLTNQDKNVYVFENPFRNFPSIMRYELMGDTAMIVDQRGYDKSGERKRHYTLCKAD
jgi:hypothetical protein